MEQPEKVQSAMPDQPSRDHSAEIIATPRARMAYGFLTAAVVWGLFASGGPLQVAQGGMAVAVGIGMILAAPTVALPRAWWLAGGALVLLAALAFLPRNWGYDPEWRRQVEMLGIQTGGMVTAHPAVSLQHWVRLGLTVAVGLWILGHRLGDRGHAAVLLTVASAAAGYAALSLTMNGRSDRWIWDPVETFGLFANRSHTATLLVIGVLAALTATVSFIRHDRGGWAGLSTLSGMACTVTLLGYSISRAGPLLLAIGLAAWMVSLVGRGWSRRTAIVLTAVVASVACLFWLSDTEIKSRLFRPAPVAVKAAGDSESVAPPAPELDFGLAQDGRWAIFRDTFDLLQDAWLTGTGRGMFEHVIPQYRRRSASESRCLHPESDWLLLAAEAGIPCALTLAALVAMVAVAATRSAWMRRGWSLRWGGLVAALIVPLHGIFDTPGHLPILSLLALLLVAAAFRPSGHDRLPASRFARLSLRLAGVLTVAGGGWLLRAEWSGHPSPAVAAPFAISEASRLYTEDQAAHQSKTPTTTTATADPANDLLRQALVATEHGLRTAPLDTTLHYQRGMLALHFDELDAIADQSFAVQRLLEPRPHGVALRQAQGWASIDPKRTARLWEDALRRTEETARVSDWAQADMSTVRQKILFQARASEPLMRHALDLLRQDPIVLRAWARQAPASLLDSQMPTLLNAATPDDRPFLLEIWKDRGTRSAAESFEADPPAAGN